MNPVATGPSPLIPNAITFGPIVPIRKIAVCVLDDARAWQKFICLHSWAITWLAIFVVDLFDAPTPLFKPTATSSVKGRRPLPPLFEYTILTPLLLLAFRVV
jgi:hypothetical protein